MRVFDVKGFPVPLGMQAITIGAWIFTKSRELSLMAHERVHVEQFRRNPFTFWVRYLFSKKRRLAYEAEAYAASVDNGANVLAMTEVLSSNYRLNITKQDALKEIQKYTGRR